MAMDLITWAPEVQLCFAFLLLLWCGTGPVVYSVAEGWMLPKKSLLVGSSPSSDMADAGPQSIPTHLSWWGIIWCLLGSFLLLGSPLRSLQGGGVFLKDNFTLIMTAVLYIYAALRLLVAIHWYKAAKVIHREYLLLILLAILGQHLLIMRTDLMAVYLCLELQSFSLVVLCRLNYTSAYAVEAGMKYFLLSAFSSCLLLLGIGLIYWQTGLTRCAHIHELLVVSTDEVNVALWLGLWLVSLGLLWKLAAAPLHFWAADVYQGAWRSISLLMSTLPKISVLGFWVHNWHNLWVDSFGNALIFFSAASLIIGAIAPLTQVQLKRLMAFSRIGHMGFMLMPLSSAYEGTSSLFVYLGFYLIRRLVIWALLLWPYGRASQTVSGPQYIWDLGTLNLSVPAAAFAWTIRVLSLAGLPPAAGFLGKLRVFWVSLAAHQYGLLCLALVATLISRVYYLRILKVMFVDKQRSWGIFQQLRTERAYIIAVFSRALLLLLWHARPLMLFSHLLSLYNII